MGRRLALGPSATDLLLSDHRAASNTEKKDKSLVEGKLLMAFLVAPAHSRISLIHFIYNIYCGDPMSWLDLFILRRRSEFSR